MDYNRYLKSCIILLLFIVLLACEDRDNRPPIIEDELNDYVNRFVAEAQLRGRTISLNNFEAKFGDLHNVCGNGSSNPARIQIDRDCWTLRPDLAKELLMFHELGHAILMRPHDMILLPNSDYKSIMCEEPSFLYNEYTPDKRSYYLDELFGVVSGLPDWASEKTIESVVFTEEILETNSWQFNVSNANHQGSLVDTTFSSPSHSLAIKSNAVGPGYSYWSYTWIPKDIEVGSELLLKVKIKASGLTGGGAYFAFRADVHEVDYPIFLYSIQDKPVTGNTEFDESVYSIKVNYFPTKIDELKIYLILDGSSSGTVFFDDIQLLKYR